MAKDGRWTRDEVVDLRTCLRNSLSDEPVLCAFDNPVEFVANFRKDIVVLYDSDNVVLVLNEMLLITYTRDPSSG